MRAWFTISMILLIDYMIQLDNECMHVVVGGHLREISFVAVLHRGLLGRFPC